MSKGATTQATPTERGRGKRGYRAPELLLDPNLFYSKKVDIWSLGCLLYELCIGQKAFEGDGATLQFSLEKKQRVVIIPGGNGGLYSGLERLICQALHASPGERPSATTLRAALKEVAEFLNVSGNTHATQPDGLNSLGSATEASGEEVLSNLGTGTSTAKQEGVVDTSIHGVLESALRFIVAIDFGTTFTAVAYSSGTSSLESEIQLSGRLADTVDVIKSWPGLSLYYAEKTPTIIAYNSNPPTWGGSVKPHHQPVLNLAWSLAVWKYRKTIILI